MNRSTKILRRKSHRHQLAVTLVEVLVALLLGTLMSAAVLHSFGISMRLSSATQNDLIAHAILKDLQEWTRAQPYSYLAGYSGQSVEVKVNRLQSGETVNFREPLMLDVQAKVWSSRAVNGRFLGNVTYTISPGVNPDELRIDLDISWNDSTRYSDKKHLKSFMILSNIGKGAWMQ